MHPHAVGQPRAQCSGMEAPLSPTATEEVEDDIVYEARVDRDVSRVVDKVRGALEARVQAVRDLARAAADRADADVDQVADDDGRVEAEVVASTCRKVRLALGKDVEEAWMQAVDDAADCTRDLVDSHLEAHATKTHRRLRWLKGRFVESLQTQRGASTARERALHTEAQGAQKQALTKQRELHRAAIAEVLDRIQQQKETSKAKYDAKERQCALAEGRLANATIAVENLSSELSLYTVKDDDNSDDVIARLFIAGEQCLRSTGVSRLHAFERGDLCKRGDETGIGMSSENFRKVKGELQRLKGTVRALEIHLDTAQTTLQKRDWALTDAKSCILKEKQRCDKLLDSKKGMEKEIRNYCKRIDSGKLTLEKCKRDVQDLKNHVQGLQNHIQGSQNHL